MTLVIDPPRRTAAVPVRRPRRMLPWLLAAGWFAQVCVRLWFARARTGPVANPDETGYLVAARWLAGGHGADLSGNTFYQAGYPLLLTPAYWVGQDPVTVYTIVTVINALAGACLFPLGYLAARRFGLSRRSALPLAWAAALLPAVTVFGAFALADAVLPVLVLGWLLLLDRFARAGRARDAVAASAVVACAACVHSRGSVLLAVHVGALAVLAAYAWFRAPREDGGEDGPKGGTSRAAWARACLAGLAAVVIGYLLESALNDSLKAALYPGGTRDLAGNLEHRLTTLDGQAWALSGAAGQVWYLVVSTWGLAGAGLVAVAAALLRRRTPAATRVAAGALLAATCGIAYASSAALPDEHRVGNFVYGRYLACLALVYALAGAAVLVRAGTRPAARCAAGAALVLAGTGLWVTAYAGERLRTHSYIAFDFPETSFLTGDRTALHLVAASFAALGLLCAFLGAGRAGRRAPAAVAVLLAGVNVAAATFVAGPSPKRVEPVPPLARAAVSGGVTVDPSLDWRLRTMLMYPVWWTRIGHTDTRAGRPAPGVCTVVVGLPEGAPVAASWPRHPAGWRAEEHRSWNLRWVAWYAPSCP